MMSTPASPAEQQQMERTKPDFSREGMLSARERTWEAVQAISERMEIGMTEEDAYRMAGEVLKELGAEKGWHRPIVRFGRNTLKTFSAPSEPGTRLEKDSVYFVDIGPVWDGYEGDAGATFVTGSDPDMVRCHQDVQKLFEAVEERWRQGVTGQALYQWASEEAGRMGWVLNLDVDGHRLGDFPHAVYFKGSLKDVPFQPSPYVWVLEIQIRHPERDFGAFYEDLLY